MLSLLQSKGDNFFTVIYLIFSENFENKTDINFYLVFNANINQVNMKLYVGNLPWSVDNSKLEELFSDFGTVVSANVITDRATNRSRGFGFVELESGGPEAIEAMNDSDLEGRKLNVNEAKPRT